jgi:putative membrane protein
VLLPIADFALFGSIYNMKEEQAEQIKTHFSNERTLLSYFRTAISLFVLAAAVFKFLGNTYAPYIGWALVVLGLVGSIVGFTRYKKRQTKIEQMG